MIYKSVEIFNIEEIINNEDGSISWLRVPDNVFQNLESGNQGIRMAKNSTGVEIRFVLKGQKAIIKMCTSSGQGSMLYSVVNGIGNLLLLIALLYVPASVQYPVVTGGTIVISTLISLIKRDKITKKELMAAGIAFVATCFMAL